MTDMTKDMFADTTYGKLALEKLKPFSENFRLFQISCIDSDQGDGWDVIEVFGAEYRHADSGPDEGKLTVQVLESRRSVCVTRTEIAAFETTHGLPRTFPDKQEASAELVA